MGSKHKDKKKKHQHHENPEAQQQDKNVNNIVEKEEESPKEETLEVTIQIVPATSDKMSPIVAYFPSNFKPSEHPSDVTVYQHETRKSRYEVVVKPKGSDVAFVGTNYSGEGAAPQICSYALGVLDKDTQTLKIHPITANKIFRMEPKFDAIQDEAQPISKDEVDYEEKKQRSRHLDAMYSTKKTNTRNKKMDSLHQKEDPRSQQDLEKSLENVKVKTEALDAVSTNARNIPFYDISASTPEKAYPLEKIIEKGEWDFLGDLLNIPQEVKVTPDAYPIFVCNRVHKLRDIKDEYKKSTVAGVLQYIAHLIKYKDKHSMDHYKSVKNHRFPSILEEKFRNMFDESGSKKLSTQKNKLLISHVLVLTLFVDDYRSDPSDIAKDLKTSVVDLRTHWKELGCKLVREKSSMLATLPVPLNFPVMREKRRNRPF